MSETIITVILPIIACIAALFNILVALTVILKKKLILDSTIYSGELVLADTLFVMLLKTSFSYYQLTLIFLAVILIWCIFLVATKFSDSVYYRIFGVVPEMNARLNEKLSEIKEENNIPEESLYLYCSDKKSPFTALVAKKAEQQTRKNVIAEFNGFLVENCARPFSQILTIVLNIAAMIIVFVRII